MSHEVVTPAYKTKIGNLTAKSILVLIADNANADGFGWPSIPFIVDRTEICKRTVLRVIQVFIEIGLVVKTYDSEKERKGFQITLEMLGQNLTEKFKYAYSKAQGEVSQGQEKCLTDTEQSVSQTQNDVSQTKSDVSEGRKSVSQTQPPHPLKGGTVRTGSEPVVNQEPDTVDNRILCESIGVFAIRQQEEIFRLYKVAARDLKLSPAQTREKIIARWDEYQRKSSKFDWKWGSAHKFLISGLWNKPEMWPQAKQGNKADPMAGMTFINGGN